MKRQRLRADQSDFVRCLSANDDGVRQDSSFVCSGKHINNARENLWRDVTEPAESVPVLRLDARALRAFQKIVHPRASVERASAAQGRFRQICSRHGRLYFTVRLEPSRD